MRSESKIGSPSRRTVKGPSDAWFAGHSLEQSRAWLQASENYERCGFGTPKLRFIAGRMRQRISELEASEVPSTAAVARIA